MVSTRPASTKWSAVALGYLLLFPLYVLRGWVLSILWRWYVIPPTGWHGIGVAVGAGLVLLASVFRNVPRAKDGEPEFTSNGDVLRGVTLNAAGALMALGLGWIFLQFT